MWDPAAASERRKGQQSNASKEKQTPPPPSTLSKTQHSNVGGHRNRTLPPHRHVRCTNKRVPKQATLSALKSISRRSLTYLKSKRGGGARCNPVLWCCKTASSAQGLRKRYDGCGIPPLRCIRAKQNLSPTLTPEAGIPAGYEKRELERTVGRGFHCVRDVRISGSQSRPHRYYKKYLAPLAYLLT